MDCQRCGKSIDPERIARSRRIKYCSTECNKRAYSERNGKSAFIPQLRRCQECGEQFLARLPHAIFCCKRCGQANNYRAQQRVRESIKAAQAAGKLRSCEVCGASFTPRQMRTQTTCSRPCFERLRVDGTVARSAARRAQSVRKCAQCGSTFAPSKHMGQKYCTDECRRLSERLGRIRREYNLSEADYWRIFNEQSGCCAICRVPESLLWRALAVDHDHGCCSAGGLSCGTCVRGLLCSTCNQSLGQYEATGYLPPSFAEYVSKYQAEPVQLRLA